MLLCLNSHVKYLPTMVNERLEQLLWDRWLLMNIITKADKHQTLFLWLKAFITSKVQMFPVWATLCLISHLHCRQNFCPLPFWRSFLIDRRVGGIRIPEIEDRLWQVLEALKPNSACHAAYQDWFWLQRFLWRLSWLNHLLQEQIVAI